MSDKTINKCEESMKYGLIGDYPIRDTCYVWTDIHDIHKMEEGKKVRIQGRIHTMRKTSKVLFYIIRSKEETLQAILAKSDGATQEMIGFGSGLSLESIIEIEGIIKVSPSKIMAASINYRELQINSIFVISLAKQSLPITIMDASRPEHDSDNLAIVNLNTRLNNRVIDLRTQTNQAIFRVQGLFCKLFRNYLDAKGFVEIHTPKIISTASEGGSAVFRIDYFKTNAYLAQSPQLYKQMAILADFPGVYEVGPIFRAENSDTHRHLTEFVGLDMEMTIREHYHEARDFIANMLTFMLRSAQKDAENLILDVSKQYPSTSLLIPDNPVILTFDQGLTLLKEAGVVLPNYGDLSTENEKLLGKLVKEKFNTDFYVLDNFPKAIRPFYTMTSPDNPNTSNSYDFFLRGEEILSGAQRINDPQLLINRATELGINPDSISSYVDAFKYGAHPHAGCGIGLERLTMLFLGLPNIRLSSMFPRDPKRLSP